MNKTRKYTQFLAYIVGTTLLLAVASQPASASLITGITVNYAGSASFGSGGVGYYYGSVAPNPNSATRLVGVGIGGDSFTSANNTYEFSSTGQFNAWCVDIYHWMSGGTFTYTVGTGSDLAAVLNTLRPGIPTGMARVAQLDKLANEVYSSVDTETESAAFQLAVWAITYGTADGSGYYSINTTDSNFRADKATVSSPYGVLANSWLTNLGTTPDTGNFNLTYLNDGTGERTQDMIVFTADRFVIENGTVTVPEPATLGLFSIGLLGMEYSRKKFRREPHNPAI